jgi:GT2 family glycosyltransferase
MKSVAAIIATYNRRRDLEICINALIRQTTPPGAIYVIDNASTDDTAKMISDSFGDDIQYVRLPENTGSAGGFRAGMELAFNAGFEWLWITDNDSIPSDDSLEKLLGAASKNPDVLALAPVKRRTRDGQILNCDCIWERRTDKVLNPTDMEYRECGLIEVDWVANTGLLINREAIVKAGHLRADLFAYGEDTEYCLRLRHYTRILLVTNSIVTHPDMGTGWPVPIQSLPKLYYAMRNDTYLRVRGMKRPQLTIVMALWHYLRASINILRKQDHPWQRLRAVTFATYHGLIGRLGVTPSNMNL